MYGAFIGDIVGSKYEFRNIKTKNFSLFSEGCDYTDDTIMTVAVAKAIMLSRKEQHEKNEKGKGFQEFLIETMQDFGRRYPNPTGAYGGSFAKWLTRQNPKPYGSYGNGSAMRVSPCGLAAVTLDEALSLARASACITHNHPEGIKGAEAVGAAVFMAKCGYTKEEIGQYIREHYYKLDFTLDSIRDSYQFDGSCQGTVPQALAAFLESENFEDAIRNAISIGGDSDTIGAITGSIAWVYYAARVDGYWHQEGLERRNRAMLQIKLQAIPYLPKEFVDIAEEFLRFCELRSAAFHRIGMCSPILNQSELATYDIGWGEISSRNETVPSRRLRSENSSQGGTFDRNETVSSCCLRSENSSTSGTSIQNEDVASPITKEIRDTVTEFCKKYIVLLEVLYRDTELNQWSHGYSAYERNTQHCEPEKVIRFGFLQEAYALGFLQKVLTWKPYFAYQLEDALNGTEDDLLFGICVEIRKDYGSNGYLINGAIANGNLYRLMRAYLSYRPKNQYTLEYIMARKGSTEKKEPGGCRVRYDQSTKEWRLEIQLDWERLWFLSVFVRDDGSFEKYSLDEEAADDSHYEFTEERKIRNSLYISGDENKYFHEILIRFLEENSGGALLALIRPYITKEFHFY